MKSFDLNALGVVEMTQEELVLVDGGNFFVDAWNWIKGAAHSIAQSFKQLTEKYGPDIALGIVEALAIAGALKLTNLK
jgi:hypothetical protein